MFHFNIEEELKKLPAKPGVYLMHDEKDQIIYVGKAITWKNNYGSEQITKNNNVKYHQRGYWFLFLFWFERDTNLCTLQLQV